MQITRPRHDALTKKPARVNPITGRKLSSREIERASLLHRKFCSAEPAIAQGATLREIFEPYARRSATRKFRLGFQTLIRLFSHWQKSGRTRECLYGRWRGLQPSVSSRALVSFIDFCTERQFPCMLMALAEFNRGKPRFNYQQLVYFFGGQRFARLQSAQRAIKHAEAHLESLRVEYSNYIRQRVPVRPRRTAQDRSLESAQL